MCVAGSTRLPDNDEFGSEHHFFARLGRSRDILGGNQNPELVQRSKTFEASSAIAVHVHLSHIHNSNKFSSKIVATSLIHAPASHFGLAPADSRK